MGTLLQDLRFAVRMLGRSPLLTAALVVTLALGIGANTTIFSIVDGVLLKPLAVPQPKQIVELWFEESTPNGLATTPLSYAEYGDISAATGAVFSDTAAFGFGLDGIKENGAIDRALTNYVSGDYFTVLGVKPALGRLIVPGEGAKAGTDPVIVLGYNYWRVHFAGNPAVVGQNVEVNGHPLTVIGVAPRGFHGMSPLIDPEAYMPLGMAMTLEPSGYPANFLADRGQRALQIFARLRPGVSMATAQAAANVVNDRMARAYPKSNGNYRLAVFAEQDARPGPDPQHTVRTIAMLFLLLAGLVLLLACVNVANILLVRAGAREREIAVRAALGAGRVRLIRQMLTESLLLAGLGGAAGLMVGIWASQAIDHLRLGTSLPILLDFGFDRRVFLYGLGAAVFTGIVAGVAPALRAAGSNLNPMLQSGTRVAGGRQWMRSTLVCAQVAASLVLLVAAGLFWRSLAKAQTVDLGFDPKPVALFSLDPEAIGYSNQQGENFDHALLQRVRALPGVTGAALAFSTPMGYINNFDTLEIPGYVTPPGQPPPAVGLDMVSPGYFATLGIPLLAGRDFSDSDTMTSPHVAIVNQAMAAKYWPGQSPIGHGMTMNSDKAHPLTIVGIVHDSVTGNLFSRSGSFFYVPEDQNYVAYATLLVRAPGAVEAVMRPVESAVAELAPGLSPFDVQTMEQSMDGINGYLIFRLGAVLAGALGAIGLTLAMLGVYGVIAYSTEQRTHEIGIRMALGAEPRAVLMLVFTQGLVIVGVGVGAGLILAFALGRLLGQFLLGVSGADPVTFASVTVALAAAALLASFVPAWRATQLDPYFVLRQE